MTIEINTRRATIFIITKTIITITIRYGEKNFMFIAKKVVTLANIHIISNGKQKNFGDKMGEIGVNTIYF